MITITLQNEKGGVGKTTMAIHIAMWLAAHGYRVLFIDADPQGTGTLRCGLKKNPGLYDLMVRDAEWGEVSMRVPASRYQVPGGSPTGELNVVPSNVETRNIAMSIDDVATLGRRLEELREDGSVDFVIIDTSPTPSLLHASIYMATDGIIFPTELAFSSFGGLVDSLKRKSGADKARHSQYTLPAINVLGIVPMKARLNTIEQQINFEELKKQFGKKVLPVLPQSTLWTESEPTALPIWKLDAKHQATLGFFDFMDSLMIRIEGMVKDGAA